MSDWLTKRKLFLIIIGVAVLLFAVLAIPHILPPGYESASVPLAVRVRVMDRERQIPVQGAIVRVPGFFEEVTTSADGYCEAIARFRATGTLGRSGRMHLYGTMTVTAPGYQTWERSFASLFGTSYDYFNKGTSVTYTVTLVR